MPVYLSFAESKTRCRNIICGQCGRTLRPLKQGDHEKRFSHLTCIEKWDAMVREIELNRDWENYMREHAPEMFKN